MSLSEPDPVDLREVEYYRGKAYEVLFYGEKIGVVRHCFPSFERGRRQAMWVTKRWQAKRPYWEYVEISKLGRPSIPYETRKRAVEQLIRFAAQADRSPEGQDGETRLDRNDESAVAESDAPTTDPNHSIEIPG